MATVAQERARRILAQWRKIDESRDSRILSAYKAGLEKMEIHRLTGVGRMTIDRIIERSEAECQTTSTK